MAPYKNGVSDNLGIPDCEEESNVVLGASCESLSQMVETVKQLGGGIQEETDGNAKGETKNIAKDAKIN
eukprot:CAMPEP_0198150332 /NCGR_PEP_ID=MMETSP1443-20131203/50413_1 /TAXON_ID=186043 /ORGANISM="Entomoneis sp., Strain CCMP2396" /LENGTH=68 /DNA_ID=CAMNT_0043815611 /DNA_START=66 /DNA_END=269 /DNA_ORIENTATION=+